MQMMNMNESFFSEYGNFSNVTIMNDTVLVAETVSYVWKDILSCVSAAILLLVNGFLLCIVNGDKHSYRKSYSLPLLNYLLNHTLFGLFYYFYQVHINIYSNVSPTSCVFILTIYTVLNLGTICFMVPICLDVIVQYFKPNLHAKQPFLTFQAISIAVIWAILFSQTITINVGQSIKDLNFCVLYVPIYLVWYQIGFALFFDCLLITCVMIQLYIAARRDESLTQTFNTLAAPTTIALFLAIFNTISISSLIIMAMYIHSNLFHMYDVIEIIRVNCSIFISLLWLCDSTIRQSIRKKFTKTNPKEEDMEDEFSFNSEEI